MGRRRRSRTPRISGYEYRRLDLFLIGIGPNFKRRTVFFRHVPFIRGRIATWWLDWVYFRHLTAFFYMRASNGAHYSGPTLFLDELRRFLE